MFTAFHLLFTIGLMVAFPAVTVYTLTRLEEVERVAFAPAPAPEPEPIETMTYALERLNYTTPALDPEILTSLLSSQGLSTFTLAEGTKDGQLKMVSLESSTSEAFLRTQRGTKLLTTVARQAHLLWDNHTCCWRDLLDTASWFPGASQALLPSLSLPSMSSLDGVVVETSENGNFVAVSQFELDTVTVFRRDNGCSELTQLQVIQLANLTGPVTKSGTPAHFGRTLKFNESGYLLAIFMPGDHFNSSSTGAMGSAYVFEFSESTQTFQQAFDRVFLEDTVTDANSRLLAVSSDGLTLLIGYPNHLQGKSALFRRNETHWNLVETQVGVDTNARLGTCGALSRNGSVWMVGSPGAAGSDTPLEGAGRLLVGRAGFQPVTVFAPSAFELEGLGSACGMDASGNVIWAANEVGGGTSRVHVFEYGASHLAQYLNSFNFPSTGTMNAAINPAGTLMVVRTRSTELDTFRLDVLDLVGKRVIATFIDEDAPSPSLVLSEDGRALWTSTGTLSTTLVFGETFFSGSIEQIAHVASTGAAEDRVVVGGTSFITIASATTCEDLRGWAAFGGNKTAVASYLDNAGTPMVIAASGGTSNLFRVGEVTFSGLYQVSIPAAPVAVGWVVNGTADFAWVCTVDKFCRAYDATGALAHATEIVVSGALADADQLTSGSGWVMVVTTELAFTVVDETTGSIVDSGTLDVGPTTSGKTVTSVQLKHDFSGFYVSFRDTGVGDFIRRYDYPDVTRFSRMLYLEEFSCHRIQLSPVVGDRLACASTTDTAPVIATDFDDLRVVAYQPTSTSHTGVGWSANGERIILGSSIPSIQSGTYSVAPEVRSFS